VCKKGTLLLLLYIYTQILLNKQFPQRKNKKCKRTERHRELSVKNWFLLKIIFNKFS